MLQSSPMPNRLAAIAGLLLAVGCAPPGTTEPPVSPPPSRSFFLALTDFPAAADDGAVAFAYETIARDGDMAAWLWDDGVPWPEALVGAPYAPGHMAEIQRRVAGTPSGHGVYVAVTPVSYAHDGLALYKADVGNMPLPPPWSGRTFDHPEVIGAYINHCERMIAATRPLYFAYATEANLLFEVDPEEWPAFLRLVAAVYPQLKARHPNMPLMMTVQADVFNGDRAAQTEAVRQMLPYTDLMAVTSYAFRDESDPGRLPPDHFSALRDLARTGPSPSRKPLTAEDVGSRTVLRPRQRGAPALYATPAQRGGPLQARFVTWPSPAINAFWLCPAYYPSFYMRLWITAALRQRPARARARRCGASGETGPATLSIRPCVVKRWRTAGALGVVVAWLSTPPCVSAARPEGESARAGRSCRNTGSSRGHTPRGWSQDEKTTSKGRVSQDLAVFRSGSASLKLEPNEENGGEQPLAIFQLIPGAAYRGGKVDVSGYVRAEGGATAVLGMLSIAGGRPGNLVVVTQPPGNPEWVRHDRTYDVPDDAAVQLVLLCSVAGRSGKVWFDDLSVSAPGAGAGADAAPAAPPPAPEGALAASVEVDAGTVVRAIPRTLYGANVEWIWDGYGLWERGRLSPALLRLTRELGDAHPYPGGYYSDFTTEGRRRALGEAAESVHQAVQGPLTAQLRQEEALDLASAGRGLLIHGERRDGDGQEAADGCAT